MENEVRSYKYVYGKYMVYGSREIWFVQTTSHKQKTRETSELFQEKCLCLSLVFCLRWEIGNPLGLDDLSTRTPLTPPYLHYPPDLHEPYTDWREDKPPHQSAESFLSYGLAGAVGSEMSHVPTVVGTAPPPIAVHPPTIADADQPHEEQNDPQDRGRVLPEEDQADDAGQRDDDYDDETSNGAADDGVNEITLFRSH